MILFRCLHTMPRHAMLASYAGAFDTLAGYMLYFAAAIDYYADSIS